MHRGMLALTLLAFFAAPAVGQAPANLLRNARFQDDWLTLLPENKNHNWNYATEFYHRRDYNPDGWTFKGSWQWLDADARWGQRPCCRRRRPRGAERSAGAPSTTEREGFPDAGGYHAGCRRSKTPGASFATSSCACIKGQDVPARPGRSKSRSRRKASCRCRRGPTTGNGSR